MVSGNGPKQSKEYRAHQLLCQIVLVLEFLVGCLIKGPAAMPSATAAPSRPGYKLIFRAFITLKNGKQIHLALVPRSTTLLDAETGELLME